MLAQIGMRTRDDMHRGHFADLAGRLCTRLGGGLDRADVALDDDRDEPAADLVARDDFHVRGLDHGGPAPSVEQVVEEPSAQPEVIPVVEPPPAAPEPAPAPVPTGPEPPPEVVPPQTGPSLLPPPPPPPKGNGRLVGGTFALALGIGASAAVGIEATREDGNPQFVAATFIPLGLASLGVGTYLLVRGAKARANYLEWERYAQREARPSGEGLLVAGVLSTVIGGVTLVAAGVQTRDPDAFQKPLAPTLFAVGGVGVLTGVATLTTGVILRKRYAGWRQATFLSVVPTFAPSARGVQVGLAGRF